MSEKAIDDPSEIAEMRRRHARLGRLAQEIALAGLMELKAKLDRHEPLNMSVSDAEALRDVGLELERMALGDARVPPRKPN